LYGIVDFLKVNQICKTSNFRWRVSSKALIVSYGFASSKKRKAIPLAQADLQNKVQGTGPRWGILEIRGLGETWTSLKVEANHELNTCRPRRYNGPVAIPLKCRGTLCLLGGIRCSDSRKEALFATIGASPPTTINGATHSIMDLS
jgi:hypothetical protein